MKKLRKMLLPMLAAVLVLGATAGPSVSYFTTHVTARGGYSLELKDVHVDVDDEMRGNTKSITVTNTGDAPCYVRVKVLQANTADVDLPITYSGEGWSQPDAEGYVYYSGILANRGDLTSVLAAAIDLPKGSQTRPIPEGTQFNVTVIAECAKIFYDTNGNAKPNGPDYEGWDLTLKEG